MITGQSRRLCGLLICFMLAACGDTPANFGLSRAAETPRVTLPAAISSLTSSEESDASVVPPASASAVDSAFISQGLLATGRARPEDSPLPRQLPFGRIAENCTTPVEKMGTKIGSEGGFALYDSAPGSTNQRSLFVTGIKGGCALQFTGSLAVFGDLEVHEFTRYTHSTSRQPYSATDQAYEAIKAKVCKAEKGEPCGKAIKRLARRTAFVTVYPRFVSSDEWFEILLHKRELVAAAVESY